jgi:hypothetical protein
MSQAVVLKPRRSVRRYWGYLLESLDGALYIESELHDLECVAVKSVLVEVEHGNLLVVKHASALRFVGRLLDSGVTLNLE